MTMSPPQRLVPSLLLPVMLRRLGSAGPVNPIAAPFRRQPSVAHSVASTLERGTFD